MIPEENVKDLADIPDNVKNHIEIIPVRWIDRVLEVALQHMPTPLSDEEVARLAAEALANSRSAGHDSGGLLQDGTERQRPMARTVRRRGGWGESRTVRGGA